ncbi:FAD-dependent oxidoreductase [Actinomadura verrucosospora]|uniref:Fumarate reductase/succinate dehydrogenase flavoprotein domain-containing protein n=1 Tax=Actinomadura verrucosospora TaxID=46165 RepID=A0A7D3VT19_ACTVE|nr:FAD-dependent oxidoreductase [Actinomadura verrucosospora]QKG18691.1 fumarate reductase/succinate dehydrogenase flavoprotein domain-containing protein [Actinomadura verrucosospora]
MTWDTEVDVAVIGGGACGVMTALRAARDPGRVVAVFEKSAREGCNAAISSGSLAAGGTRFQAAAGIDDSPQRHADDILRASGDEEWRPVVEALCEAAPRIVEWIADTGYPTEIGTDMPRAGMTALRLHTDTGRLGGGRLMRHLRALLETHDNAAFVDEAPAVDLVSDGGEVTGVVIAQNGSVQRVRADAVVLAADGFAADQTLVKQHLPHLGTPFYGGVSTSTGDALAWARRLGAQVRNMGAGLRSGLVVVDHGTRVSPALPFNGAVLVNVDGERFVDEESKGYSSMAGILQRQPGERAAMIWDATAMAATRESEMMRECLAAGAVRDCATLDDLAAALGRTPEDTERALTPLPGRRRLTAPYHLAWVTHGLLATQGGLVIDPSGRVLNQAGEPIPGLYAGGGTACGLAGPHSDGYLSGNGLLSAFGMGWIIGNALPTG